MGPGQNDTYWEVNADGPEELRAEIRERLIEALGLPPDPKTYLLIGADGVPFRSPQPGTLGGVRNRKVYGRLDCPSALRAIAKGGPYKKHRVFFADEATAQAAGYRPCAVCLRDAYKKWKGSQKATPDR